MKDTTAEHGLDAFLSAYTLPAGHFDELRAADGSLREPWRQFTAHAGDLTPAALDRAQARIARQIHENGITYNVYAAADGPSRPWTLDVLPLIVEAEEWEPLARGLRQRARLLNAVAADLYGPQRLLEEGLIPPALVFRHPGFLRPCHGVTPAGGVFLHFVAFDLARGPDGRWCVVGTRTQAPSGAGYALENRTTLSRLFLDAFRGLHVQPVAPFFDTLRSTLLAAAPCEQGTPHVVLLTPGPYNETYFEHAYLARQLGFPLVEGGDLTVRHSGVFLKTVSGLRRVHGILRRLDDDYCDPLELRSDSTLGVAGLVDAWRAGHVLVANAFGMGVLESPALFAFLPGVCERLLQERIQTPSLATWWCGEAAALRDAQQRLDTGVVKPAFPDGPMEPVFLAGVDAVGHQEWVTRLATNPAPYVVEEYLPLSHAPVWEGGALESRALMLRVFLCADHAGDYQVMPGGLLRVAGADRQVVSSQRGGGSKDIWVMSARNADAGPRPERRSRGDEEPHGTQTTSSRAAEHLFWLGRYAERSETCARLLRAVLTRLADPGAETSDWRASLLRTCRRQELLEPVDDAPASADESSAAVERALITGLFDRQTRHSLGFNVEQTVRVAGAVRDRLSSDNWRLLSRLSQSIVEPPDGEAGLDDALDVIDQTIIALVAVAGLEMAHMTRNDGWRFLSIGRHLERLSFIVSTMEDVLEEQSSSDPRVLDWLLDLSDSRITYRSRHMRAPEWPAVVDLLVLDAHNPRSALFQVAKLDKHLRLLPDGDLAEVLTQIDRVRRACADFDVKQGGLFGGVETPAELFGAFHGLALGISDALTLQYFSHVYELPHATATF
ncbi:MAG: circularly permuted type 2 ATP-grasp protein [Acidobacteriota bacterium]